MNSIKAISLAALVMLSFSACKKKNKGNAVTFDANSPEFVLTSALQQSSFNFEYISFKAKTEFSPAGFIDNFNANTRMKKGEIVWSSMTVLLGIEAARIYIEKDSVMVRDNTNRKVYTTNMGYFESFTNIPLDINQLQNAALGNPIFADSLYKLVEVQGDTIVKIKAHIGPVSNELYFENKSFKLKHSLIKDAISNNELSIKYDNHTVVNSTFLPQTLYLKTKKDDQDVNVTMEYENIKMDSISSFPFNVPNSFEVIKSE